MTREILPALYPLWHTSTFNNHLCSFCHVDFDLIPDYGGIGVDVDVKSNLNNNENIYFISSLKSETSNFFISKKCTLPFIHPNKLKKLRDPCCEHLCQQHEKEAKFLNSLFRTVHSKCKSKKQTYLNFEEQLSTMHKRKQEEIVIPQSLFEMSETMPEVLPVPKANWLYSGGCLSCVKCNINDNIPILIYSGGKHMNKVVITPLSRNLHDEKVFIHSEQQSFKFKDSILQIYTQAYQEKILCSIRQKTYCNLLSINSDNVEINTVYETSDDILTYSCLSPYIMGEYVLCTQNGHLVFRNMEKDQTIWDSGCNDILKIPTKHSDSWQGCDFGSHPRCISYSNNNMFSIADLRNKHFKCLELFSSTGFFLLPKEEITLTKLNSVQPYQHFIATTNHLVLVDERYPKQPIFLWNHLLDSFPMYCDILQIGDTSSRILLLGTHLPQQIACFQLNSSTQIQPVSHIPPLHLSTPKDIAECLKHDDEIFEDLILQRLLMPIIGACSIEHSNGFAAFQLSSVGDLFYQDFFWNTKKENLLDHSNFFTVPFKMSDIDWWIKEASLKKGLKKNLISEPFHEIDCSEQVNNNSNNCIPSISCKFCSEIKNIDKNNEELCLSCNIFKKDSEFILNSFMNETVISKLPSLCEKHHDEKWKIKILPREDMDLLSKSMFDVWFKDDTVSITNETENYDKSNVNYMSFNERSFINQNISDVNEETDEDIIPPSQEAFRKTVKIQLNKLKVSSVAGF